MSALAVGGAPRGVVMVASADGASRAASSEAVPGASRAPQPSGSSAASSSAATVGRERRRRVI